MARLSRIRLAYALAAAVLALGLSALVISRAAAAPAGFVQRCGTHFCLNGHVFYVAGANTYDVFTYGGSFGDTETQYMDKARIDAQFARLQADRVSVLRLWMFSHESWHGFEPSRGVYNEQQFALFDYVISSAGAHNVRLIPVFENYWEAYGGIDTRLSWEGLSGGHPGRGKFFNKSICPGCFTQYKNYVNFALNRTNHYSGVKYKDDPTIFGWELMNEPRYQDQSPNENTTGTTLRAWVDEMGAYVKSIDPNHLLGTGLEGHGSKYGFGGDEGNPFVFIHQSPSIDFTSAHPYPNESWANLSLDQTKALIRAWISDSHGVVGKPFLLGEFNTKNVDRTTWWSSLFTDFEAADGDATAFWWYQDHQVDGTYGVSQGAPELAAFRTHSDHMATKSGGTPPPTVSTSPSVSPSASRSPSSSPTPSPTGSGAGCAVKYTLNDWGGGFTADITVTNTGATTINGWTLAWSFSGNQLITNLWNGIVTQNGQQVSVRNADYNPTIAGGGGTVNLGFQASYTGTNAVPAEFRLNATVCAKR
jgi:hypothetical protein